MGWLVYKHEYLATFCSIVKIVTMALPFGWFNLAAIMGWSCYISSKATFVINNYVLFDWVNFVSWRESRRAYSTGIFRNIPSVPCNCLGMYFLSKKAA